MEYNVHIKQYHVPDFCFILLYMKMAARMVCVLTGGIRLHNPSSLAFCCPSLQQVDERLLGAGGREKVTSVFFPMAICFSWTRNLCFVYNTTNTVRCFLSMSLANLTIKRRRDILDTSLTLQETKFNISTQDVGSQKRPSRLSSL